jgi:hypothetical protein
MIDPEALKCMADDKGYTVVFHKENPPLIRIQKENRRQKETRIQKENRTVDIWYTTGTVGEQKQTPYGYRLIGACKKDLTITHLATYL